MNENSIRCSLKKTTYTCSSSLQGEAHYKYTDECHEQHQDIKKKT